MTDKSAEGRFTNTDATEARAAAPVPLIIGLSGPSGSGKTFTALRLATGIQEVVGGDIFMVDTEQRRSLHYSDRFKFRHVQFSEPFGALDYREALRYCKAQGAGVVVVDSMSHAHDGPGGMLEQHDTELTRMAGTDYGKRERMTMLAWQKPKQAIRKLVTAVTTELDMPVIFCFRARATTKPVKDKATGKQTPVEMGYTAIMGEELLFEMGLNALFLPSSGGRPTWHSDKPGENAVIKLPLQFKWMADMEQPLNEEVGRKLAEWARGTATGPRIAPTAERQPSTPAGSTVTDLDAWAADVRERIATATDASTRPFLLTWWNSPGEKRRREPMKTTETFAEVFREFTAHIDKLRLMEEAVSDEVGP